MNKVEDRLAHEPRWFAAVGCLVVALAVAAVFHDGLGYGLFCDWDDTTFVLQNPYITFKFSNLWYYFIHPFQDLHTPLPMWSLMLDHALFGANGFGYHLHNLLLQCSADWAFGAGLPQWGRFSGRSIRRRSNPRSG